jgi:hypothetical protein
MMQFADPAGLLALASLPAIVALHILRPRRRAVIVASTSFWIDALSERQRGIGWQRLLRSLSLLLLLLAALAGSLALGEPQWVTAARESTDTVLILDTSASMKARSGIETRFEEALDEAAGVIESLPEGARALIMTSASKAALRTGFEADRDTLARALRTLTASDEAGSPAEAVTLALSLLRDREAGRVVFVTDGAFEGDDIPATPQLHYRMVGTPADNVAITRFDFRRERSSEDRFQVMLSLRNYSDERRSVPLSVNLERRTLLSRQVDLAAGEAHTLVLPFEGKALGRARAVIGSNDALATDNQAHAVVNVAEPLRVLLATPGNFYLESVLDASPGIDVTRVDGIEASAIERLAIAHDVIIADRVPLAPLPPGNFLLLDTVPPGLAFETAGRIDAPSILAQGNSALMQGIDLGSVRIDEARRITRKAESPGLQRLFWSSETDLGLALLEDRRRVLYLGFDLARSNLPLQTAFPVLIRQGLGWLASGRADQTPAQRTWFAAGERVTLHGPASQRDVILRRPDGEGRTLVLEDGVLVLEDTTLAGV